ncbi:MAG: hypothetical protein QOG62_280 [Thermoleophilaceae bacterium]|nr:hypothetical protein [Thermoleophilaceae bacterium]
MEASSRNSSMAGSLVGDDGLELTRKAKGDMAELLVAADLRRRGHRISIPFGEECDYDLIVDRKVTGTLERVQVKLARARPGVLLVQCRSHSLTNGKVKATKYYTSETIEWIAAVDWRTRRCFYIPAGELGSGRDGLTLRLEGTANSQSQGIRWAEDYTTF